MKSPQELAAKKTSLTKSKVVKSTLDRSQAKVIEKNSKTHSEESNQSNTNQSEEPNINFAKIKFAATGVKKIVPINHLSQFNPKHKKDFKNKIYFLDYSVSAANRRVYI